jgi:hypothetical protein
MNTFKCFILIVLSFFVYACSNLTNEAIKYNDLIIERQQKIVSLFNKLDSSFVDTINKSYIQNLEILKKEIENQFTFIDTIASFNGSDEYKNEYKTLLNAYYETLNNEYQNMIEWNSLPNEQFTKEVSDKFYKTYENANKKIEKAVNKFIEFQKSFAQKYKFNLIDQNTNEN